MKFTELPDVMIQDPIRDRVFVVPQAELEERRTTPRTWANLSPNTVTFVIPDDDALEEIPPFSATADAPDVLIQWAHGDASYYVPYCDLKAFEVPKERERGVGYGVSFIIPRGTELIEELPALRIAMLQTGESGM